MAILVKVDEDLPEDVAAVFASAGYSASTVRSEGLTGAVDDDLWRRVQSESRWLVTADKGFGDVRKFVPSQATGIVLIRADLESRRRYVELATQAVRTINLEDVAGNLVVVTAGGIRVRRFLRAPR